MPRPRALLTKPRIFLILLLAMQLLLHAIQTKLITKQLAFKLSLVQLAKTTLARLCY